MPDKSNTLPLPLVPPAPGKVGYLAVEDGFAGQRIDNYLYARLKAVPRSRIYRMLRAGEVRVNRQRVRPSYRVREGDIVRIPPLHPVSPVPEALAPPPELCRRIEAAVLYEGAGWLALNKPAGLAVHGGTGLRLNLLSVMRRLRPQTDYLELAHRLDRETSGCLLLATRPQDLRTLHRLFRQRRVSKSYLALLRGRPPAGDIELPLRRRREAGVRHSVVPDPDGRRAFTRLSPRHRFGWASLTEIETFTGRTHQIRAHVRAIGYPIAGDKRYGERDFNRRLRQAGLRRLFLHAYRIGFPDPDSGEDRLIEAPLPEELERTLACLKLQGQRGREG